MWSDVLFISCISYAGDGEVVVVAITLRKQVEVCGRVLLHEHVCLHCSDPQSQPANIVSRLRWRKYDSGDMTVLSQSGYQSDLDQLWKVRVPGDGDGDSSVAVRSDESS